MLTKVIERAVRKGSGYKGDVSLDLLDIEASTYKLLFSHDFAKAYWKTGKSSQGYDSITVFPQLDGELIPAWKVYLQRAVLSKNPIEFYYKNK